MMRAMAGPRTASGAPRSAGGVGDGGRRQARRGPAHRRPPPPTSPASAPGKHGQRVVVGQLRDRAEIPHCGPAHGRRLGTGGDDGLGRGGGDGLDALGGGCGTAAFATPAPVQRRRRPARPASAAPRRTRTAARRAGAPGTGRAACPAAPAVSCSPGTSAPRSGTARSTTSWPSRTHRPRPDVQAGQLAHLLRRRVAPRRRSRAPSSSGCGELPTSDPSRLGFSARPKFITRTSHLPPARRTCRLAGFTSRCRICGRGPR